MTHKSTFIYRAILHWLLEYGVHNNIQIQWQHFMADFEQAIKGTLQHLFGNNLEWNGCYFHFGQAINRKIQEIGLIT